MNTDNLAAPFELMVLRVPVTAERIKLNCSERIVAVATGGRGRRGAARAVLRARSRSASRRRLKRAAGRAAAGRTDGRSS